MSIMPLDWSNVQLLVSTLFAAMLALSAHQVRPVLRLQRPGSWLVRLSAVVLLVASWRFVDFDLAIPGVNTPDHTTVLLASALRIGAA
ncbi:MAG: hypothetical protein R2867_45950 [Caldilineaceae bacterium]